MPDEKKISLRAAFGQGLLEMAEEFPELRVVACGTANSDGSELFGKTHSDRFFNVGIDEPTAVSLAAGLAMAGGPVIIADMSIFYTMAYGQLITAARQAGIHLIVAASHAGITVGADGGSAQDITDVARMRLIPGVTIVTPWDGDMVKTALTQMLGVPGLYYLRLNRGDLPQFTASKGWTYNPLDKKTIKLAGGNNYTVVAMGDMVYPALQAVNRANAGECDNAVADMFGVVTVEPLETASILESVRKTHKLMVVEDHMSVGGLGEQLSAVIAKEGIPFIFKPFSLPREFGTSGEPDELLEHFGLDVESLAKVL